MKNRLSAVAGIIMAAMLAFVTSSSTGAELKLPSDGGGSGMFVASVTLATDDDCSVQISFEPSVLQFAGSVIPDPDVQLLRDGFIEIATGTTRRQVGLKFFFLPPHDRAILSLVTKGDLVQIPVQLQPSEGRNAYHLHILIVALGFLTSGVILWIYKNRKVDLMSTRSLFLNFEELEKARREHRDNAVSSEKKDLDQKAGPEEKALEPGPGSEPPEKPVSPGVPDALKPSEEEKKLEDAGEVVGGKNCSDEPSKFFSVTLSDEKGRVFRGEGHEVMVGRKKDCQVVLSAAEVSRRHVCIRRKDRKFELIPVSTANLTRLNDVDVKAPVPIESGARLNLGGSLFRIEIKD